jgi:sterol desaturase/sphingolipid hydroxylase (fatty acid hydroxylase superfamily)
VTATAITSGSHLAYPLVMASGIGLHLVLAAMGMPVQASAYVCIAFGAVAVNVLERQLPQRREWQGRAEDFRNDALYLALVQSALPFVLALSLGVFATRGLRALGVEPTGFWPGSWPVPLQALLMLLAADFLRYWLHIASHRYAPLWRLHAVHHSPPRLYWLNVARFHPLEKGLQYLLDALPFVVLGVSEPVLALYFVFYAINGFFQHCNVDVRLGPLNYVISGPELHRWHHSRIAEESNNNYGNNFIVWDVLFGTSFLPADRLVGELGLQNAEYPQGFVGQLKTPFIRQLENTSRPVSPWKNIFVSWIIVGRMQFLRFGAWRRLVRAARDPRREQELVLQKILRANRDSVFGREHGFDKCLDPSAYQHAVPDQDYESLRPYIERQIKSGAPELTVAKPVMYAQTSGTTGKPKYLPVLESSLMDHRTCQQLSAFIQYIAIPVAFQGRLLGMVSPAVEEILENGVPSGSTSGFLYQSMSKVLRSKYVVPEAVFSIPDYDLKYELVLRLALVDAGITYMGSANPSTFLKLARVLRERRKELLADVETGSFGRWGELDEAVQRAVRNRLACTPERVAELREILMRPAPALRDVWPHLTLVSTWTGGSCGIALKSLREELPESARIAELGYLSSEFRGSITVDLENNRGVPTLQHHFFEFAPVDKWDREEREFLLLYELEEGCEYYVLVTTMAGLYRYFMNDIVRVTGRWYATSTIEFVRKGRGVTSITGEKLSESQLVEAVQLATQSLGRASPFFIALAEPSSAHYSLWIEGFEGGSGSNELSEAIESHLCRLNVEYAQKRASGRLFPLQTRRLRSGAGDAYKKHMLAAGQRESQFKVQPLQYAEECRFPFVDYEAQSGEQGT